MAGNTGLYIGIGVGVLTLVGGGTLYVVMQSNAAAERAAQEARVREAELRAQVAAAQAAQQPAQGRQQQAQAQDPFWGAVGQLASKALGSLIPGFALP